VSSAAQFKMAAVLDERTLEEQRAVVRFLSAKGHPAKVIHKEMSPVYDEKCLSRKAVHNWVDKFAQGRSKVVDEHRSGRPVQIA
jgi:transposase